MSRMSNSSSKSWGGKRPGSGRVRINLHLDRNTATWLKALANRLQKTEEQVVAVLVEAEWQKIEAVEEAAKRAFEAYMKEK